MARRRIIHPSSGRSLRRSGRLVLSAMAAAGCILGDAIAPGYGQSSFPFGQELSMDVAAAAGANRSPTLEIDDSGLAELDLWCASMKVRFIVVADTITALIGSKTERSCPPEQARADQEILDVLSQATNWRREEDVLVFTGGPKELRFRAHTN
jgi:META domain